LHGAGANVYIQHNLVSDQPGMADLTDPNLVNAWDIAISATSPFWISANGTGLAPVYSTASATVTIAIAAIHPSIPPGKSSSETTGPVSGQVANGTSVFLLPNGNKASFLFCTEDGTISGWNGGTAAVLMVDNSSKGSVYKGMVIGGTTTVPQLYVANFHTGKVEVYDGNFAPVNLVAGAFTDSQIPTGFAPFNIANLAGNLYVAYAKQDSMGYDDVPGPHNGYVDVFDMSGNLKTRLISGGALNSPWGMTIAPAANFGAFSGMLLVGNFGDGRINVYDPVAGTSQGFLQNPKGNAIVIPGLWALRVGNGASGGDANAVYFTAGPESGDTQHGLFGSLQAGPVLNSSAVVNGASFQAGTAQYTWVSLFGANLASTKRAWTVADMGGGKLPIQLDGAGVTIDGKPAYISYVSPTQINALVAADRTLGPVPVAAGNAGLVSSFATVTMQNLSPAFFISKSNYIAGFGPDNKTIIGPTTLFPNASAPVKPGAQISLFGTGFGPTTTPIPDGQVITSPIAFTGVTVTIGGTSAQMVSANLVMPGLYQLNVIVPAGTPNGDVPVVATVGSASTQSGALISVQQ
jgi:uncharacterized protein (TIGR03118 family)